MNSTDGEICWTLVSRNPKKEKMSTDYKKQTIMIEPEKMAFIVGRKGCNLKRLREIYGVKLILPKDGFQIIIEGPAQMVSAAKKDIEQNLSCKIIFFVEKNCASRVIGREGKNIYAIEDELNVKIVIRNDGEVSITGKRCEEAKKTIEEYLSCRTNFFVEKEYRRLVVGREANTILALEKAHNVQIYTEDDGHVSILGTNKNERKSAKKTIEQMIEAMKTAESYLEKFSVPQRLIRFVCGRDGWNVRKIEFTHGVQVFFHPSAEEDNRNVITVRGSTARKVSAAKKDILENVLGTTILDLDEILVERIIGPGGETVRQLNKEFDVVIYFDEKNQTGKGRRNVYIFSENKGGTKAAKDDIISIITGRKKVNNVADVASK